ETSYSGSRDLSPSARTRSPAGASSSLITSAPISPSRRVQVGPATNWVKSRTRYPSSIRGIFGISDSPRILAQLLYLIVLPICLDRRYSRAARENAMRLKNKVALVSGSGSGIGEATAKRLASEGASVVVVDLNEE